MTISTIVPMSEMPAKAEPISLVEGITPAAKAVIAAKIDRFFSPKDLAMMPTLSTITCETEAEFDYAFAEALMRVNRAKVEENQMVGTHLAERHYAVSSGGFQLLISIL